MKSILVSLSLLFLFSCGSDKMLYRPVICSDVIRTVRFSLSCNRELVNIVARDSNRKIDVVVFTGGIEEALNRIYEVIPNTLSIICSEVRLEKHEELKGCVAKNDTGS